MSVIRKKPFIEGVVDKLTIAQKGALLNVMNTAGNNVSASLLEMPAKGITPVLFKLDEANLKTGILIYLDDVPVTLIAYHRFQDVLLFELHPESTTYNKINEYCDINELRRILTVGEEVTAGEIDSGDTEANKVLAADGEGGAVWKDTLDTITPENVESGDAVQLFGFDAQGNLVKDDMPEGITVDQSVIEDSTNAVAGGAVYDELHNNYYNKTEADALLETKANVDGNYPTMTVGVADQLSPYDEEAGDDQDEPFSFQATGTGNGSQPDFATGSIALMKEKRGNTVVVNQLLKPTNEIIGKTGVTKVSDYELTFSNTSVAIYDAVSVTQVINGHKYFIYIDFKAGAGNGVNFYWYEGGNLETIGPDSGNRYSCFTVTSDGNLNLRVYTTGTCSGDLKYMLIDLTQWFNGDIPQDLLDHPENFFRYYQGSLAYNAGTLVNANGRYVKCIGRNQWDEEWELGYWTTSGTKGTDNSQIRCKNPIKVIPNQTYYKNFATNNRGLVFLDKDLNAISTNWGAVAGTFTTPANCCFIVFTLNPTYGTTYNHDITISIYYEDESGYNQYYPYELLTNNDTGTETLRSAGNVADSKAPDGTIHRLVGSYTFTGSETWIAYGSGYRTNVFTVLADQPKTVSSSVTPNMVSDTGLMPTSRNEINGGSAGISVFENAIVISDNTGLTGKTIYFELATPTTEQGTPYSENIVIDDFGSMDFSGTSGVPQGNLIFYPVDYKAFIDTLYNYTEGTPSNIALKSDLPTAPQTWAESLPGYDATKTQTLKNVEGTLTWVDDE